MTEQDRAIEWWKSLPYTERMMLIPFYPTPQNILIQWIAEGKPFPLILN